MKTKHYFLYLVSFVLFLALLPAPSALSQIPQGFNFQAIARDGSGNPIANTSLPVRITIQADSLGTTILWQEVHASVTSNSYGLINLVIGRGARQASSTVALFSDIDWTVTPKFIKTEIYFGTGYLTMGVSRLWSVPFAMYSTSTHPWQLNGSSLYYAGGFVGIETSTPVTPLTVTYNDNTGITYPLYIQNASGDWTATEKGVGLKFGRANPYSGHDYGTIRGTIASASGGDGRLQLIGGAGNVPHMTINHLGNVGIGTVTPTNKLQIGDNLTTGAPVAAPNAISLGSDFGSNTIGTNFKLKLYDTPTPANTYGFGLSSGLFEIVSGASGSIGIFTNGPNERMRITSNGYVGIGTTTPAQKLHVVGDSRIEGSLVVDNALYSGGYSAGVGNMNLFKLEIGGPAPTATNGQATIYMHHHSTIANQLRYTSGVLYLEAAGNGYGTTPTPAFQVNGPLYAAMLGGKVGIGTSSSSSKVAIQPESTWSDEVPLFEVKNKLGVPVLAVYNNGVRILVDHTLGKGVKSGFAVGGYDMTKAGKTVDFMVISPDSIRFNINNDNTKAVKSGFAVGGYDATKGAINQDFMYITPQGSANGNYNTFLGFRSGYSASSTGNYNSFMGFQAGYSNYSGYSNVFLGYNAGYANYGPTTLNPSNGINNVYIGTEAGLNNKGYNNVLLGDASGSALTGGYSNVYIGCSSGLQDLTGHNNTYIGTFAGRYENGSDNVMIGYGAGFGSDESNLLVIGNRNNNALISGFFNTSKLYLWAQVGIGSSDVGTYKLYVAGNAWATGTWGSSDIRWKKNITDLSNTLDKINKLNPVTFEWRTDEFPKINFDGGVQIGLIAQDVEDIFPELVKTNSDGYKAIAYDKLNAVLIKGMQEQQSQIESQQKQIDELTKVVIELRKAVASSSR